MTPRRALFSFLAAAVILAILNYPYLRACYYLWYWRLFEK